MAPLFASLLSSRLGCLVSSMRVSRSALFGNPHPFLILPTQSKDMEADPRRKAELSIPIIAYPEMLWKKQYRVCMQYLLLFVCLLLMPVIEFTIPMIYLVPEKPDPFHRIFDT